MSHTSDKIDSKADDALNDDDADTADIISNDGDAPGSDSAENDFDDNVAAERNKQSRRKQSCKRYYNRFVNVRESVRQFTY